MKKSFTKIISALLVLIMMAAVISISAFNASAVTYSGTCSTKLNWTLDTSTGKLVIGGMGAMNNYSYWDLPWGSYRHQIKTATIDNSVTSIGDYAFGWCDNLTNVTISNKITTIGICAFSNCYKLASVTIPDSVTIIGEDAFEYCYGLESVIIGNSVTTIGISAFDSCRSLENVTIGNGVITVEDYAFYDCDNLTDVYYGGTEEEWNEITIEDGNESLLNATIHYNCIFGVCGDNLTWKLNTEIGELTIDGTGAMYDYDGYNRPWESYKDNIKSVVISNGITIIGDEAFYSCDSLTSVTIPDSVATIGMGTFSYCDSLTSVTIPDSVTTIRKHAFSNCYKLASVTIPSSVTEIGDSAFYSCDSLVNIVVDADNQYYCSDSFGVLYNKDKTELIQYPVGNERTEFAIPSSVATIGEWAFSDGDSLTSITIPDSVATIGVYAFYYCKRLASVKIPDSVTNIGAPAFYSCDSLVNIVVDADNQYYCSDSFGVLYNKDKTELIQYPVGNERTEFAIPSSVTQIGDYAFLSCCNLTNITIGDSVTTIGYRAFGFCDNLTSVIIPDSVTTIGRQAFIRCERLTDVYYYGTEEEWNNISIGTDNEPLLNATIHYNYCPHSYESVVTAPTCEDKGYTTYTCECGDSYVADYVDATGHSHTAEVTTPATHTSTGVMTYTCSCGDTYTEKINKIADHEFEARVTDPTCTEQGYTTFICTCGESYTRDYVNAKGHTAGDWVVTTPATTATSGVKTLYCASCETVLATQVIPATGKVSSVAISDLSLDYKASTTITPSITVDSGVKYTVTYSSSDPSVASIDANGKVSTGKTGSATITVTVTDEFGNTVSDTCEVKVNYNWWQWIIVIVLFGWIWY